MKNICEMKKGDVGKIIRIDGEGFFSRRMRELGICINAEVELIRFAPFRDPLMIRVNETILSLRKVDAASIFVE